jgi:hypothetical protein
MRAGCRAPIAAAVLSLALGATAARGDIDATSVRSLSMGDALRAAAVGGAAMHLNPSGMTLLRAYQLEGSYLFRTSDSTDTFDVSVTDSVTSRVGAGVYFDYVNADARDPTGVKVGNRSGWESGVALAAPVADFLTIGVLPKYMSITQPSSAGGSAEGFTIDVGATLRPLPIVQAGVVGQNLVEMNSTRAPRQFAFGFAMNLFDAALADFDVVFDFDSARLEGRGDHHDTIYHLGGEYLLGGKVAVRAGYIHDGGLGQNDLALGTGIVTQSIAIDVGGRKPLDGPGDRSILYGVAVRLFLQ